ncbi:uncharacterized protein LOC114757451 [Neltuma alba]|uniref:uncharacterized protein LOC114757451 n=1 Tax=Neltuma alba TaxID=207710 RepID=UPI0010A4317B|nr:uncharacterized protein LOC114757451 [Prosopis alba]
MTGDFPKQWAKWLPLAELWYNTTYHSAIGMSPFEAVYGVAPPVHLPYIVGDSPNELVDRTCLSREMVLQLLKQHLSKAQHRMMQQANKNRSERHFSVGDMSPKEIGTVAYELDLPPETRVHPVFHVSLLKKHVGPSNALTQSLPPVDVNGHFMLEPEQLLGRKVVRRHNLPVTQVLVRWKFSQPEDATWEDLSAIKQQFLDFDSSAPPTNTILVDKDPF